MLYQFTCKCARRFFYSLTTPSCLLSYTVLLPLSPNLITSSSLTSILASSDGKIYRCNILSLQRFVRATFCPCNVLSMRPFVHATICPCDVLSMRRIFCDVLSATFCPRHYVRDHLSCNELSCDILSMRPFVRNDLSATICRATFCPSAILLYVRTKII